MFLTSTNKRTHRVQSIAASVRTSDTFMFGAVFKALIFYIVSRIATRRSFLRNLYFFKQISSWLRLFNVIFCSSISNNSVLRSLPFRETPWACLQPRWNKDTGLCLWINATSVCPPLQLIDNYQVSSKAISVHPTLPLSPSLPRSAILF